MFVQNLLRTDLALDQLISQIGIDLRLDMPSHTSQLSLCKLVSDLVHNYSYLNYLEVA